LDEREGLKRMPKTNMIKTDGATEKALLVGVSVFNQTDLLPLEG